MTEIHAFDPDGTPSPGAQAALDGAVAGLASEGFVADTVAAIPAAELSTPGLITLSTVSARAADTVQAAMSQAVTSDELFTSVVLTSSTTITTLMIAPYPLRITSALLVFDALTLPTSSSVYITATLRKFTTGGTEIVSRSSADGGISARVPWLFDAASWNSSAQNLAAGDMVNLGIYRTGGAVVEFPAMIQLGYTPL